MNLKNLYARIMQLENLYQERDKLSAYIDRKWSSVCKVGPTGNSKLRTTEEDQAELSLINMKIADIEAMEI